MAKHKGFEVHKYENSAGGVRWVIEKNGKEVRADFTTKANALNYIDSHRLGA